MSALSVLYLVLSLPVAFILHDAEEVAVQHRWMLAHRESLASRFPKLRPLTEHLSQLGTTAFAIAATEELVVLVVATCYVLVDGIFSTQIWSALFLAFSLHLFVHFGQAILFRGYVPGIVTSLLLLPYSAYGVWSIWLTTSAMEFLLLALCGMVFVAANLRFAHWLGMKICR
ncbi:MAG: HXXEE domain-containing protein [Prevotella sp.]